jgi:hypothetical protein
MLGLVVTVHTRSTGGLCAFEEGGGGVWLKR